MRKYLPFSLAFVLLAISGCIQFRSNPMFTNLDEISEREKSFFNADVIYADVFTSEGWNTKAKGCLSVENTKNAAYKGSGGLHITWNRQGPGCPWLGIGFGWDNWTGKDLSRIKNVGAITFFVRMVEGERSNLPWAIGLEDFSGRQAWLGMNTAAIKGDKIGRDWVKIELPISEFDWHDQNANASNIKQIIFNLEADGQIFMDEIRILPYEGGFRQRYFLPVNSEVSELPVFSELHLAEKMRFHEHEFAMNVVGNYLHVYGKINEPSSASNNKDIPFDVEMAFSTDKNANPRRPRMINSDQHLGFRLGQSQQVINIRTEQALPNVEMKQNRSERFLEFEAKIPLQSLGVDAFKLGALYGLEIAVNSIDNGQKKQVRWNDDNNHDFASNPARWGEFLVVE